MIRMKRLHSEPDQANAAIDNLITKFNTRRYPNKLLQECKTRALSTTRPVDQRSDKNENSLILILPFHPGIKDIRKVWQRNTNVLLHHPDTSFLAQERLLIAYKRPTNIKNILVKTDSTSRAVSSGSYPCGKIKCNTCKFMETTTTYKSSNTTQSYRISGHFDCQSMCIIYLITCKLCGIQYVGQTSSTMNNRLIGHRFDIRHQLDKPISNHFTELKHPTKHNMSNLRVIIMSKAPRDVTSRLLRETSHMRQLVTMEPFGLNSQQANI
jgi:hypothetical protein